MATTQIDEFGNPKQTYVSTTEEKIGQTLLSVMVIQEAYHHKVGNINENGAASQFFITSWVFRRGKHHEIFSREEFPVEWEICRGMLSRLAGEIFDAMERTGWGAQTVLMPPKWGK